VLFLITCRDAPGSGELRRRHLPAHRCYVDERARQLVLSGPLTDDAAQCRTGQVFVVDVEDRMAATAFIDDDPFTIGRVFEDIRIERLELRFEHGRRLWPVEEEGATCP
jgi:hypothetical protein